MSRKVCQSPKFQATVICMVATVICMVTTICMVVFLAAQKTIQMTVDSNKLLLITAFNNYAADLKSDLLYTFR